MPSRAFIGLGSNLAHPRRQLAKALARLDATNGVRLVAVSPSYVTAPIGGIAQPDFVNAVALVETTLPPRALLARLLTDIAPAIRIPGRGAARRFLPGVRAQRIQRTRTHRTLI
jgi:2-amino-4-hydroxy-6-hydroxymethyldihydropteridine diphosphokinase